MITTVDKAAEKAAVMTDKQRRRQRGDKSETNGYESLSVPNPKVNCLCMIFA